MENKILNPGEAKERLEAWKGKIDKLAADTKAMSDDFQNLKVTTQDSNKIVSVTIDGSGNLQDLDLSYKIQRLPPDTVSRIILETIDEARLRVAERSKEIIEEKLGDQSSAAEAISSQVRERLLSKIEKERE